jgi:hypothetical protein
VKEIVVGRKFPAGRKLFAQMQESLTQLRKKEYPAGEHPAEE